MARGADPLQALIIDGQNNHGDWPKTTMMMQQYLRDSRRFTVDIAGRGTRGKVTTACESIRWTMAASTLRCRNREPIRTSRRNSPTMTWSFPTLASTRPPWPAATRDAFEHYVRKGGGFVVIHAADNCFGDWQQYNRMIGLGGWGGRTEQQGPYVYLDESEQLVRDDSPGNGGHHGAQHCFQVVIREPDHPIVRGLPRIWMHAQDELYEQLRGPAENMSILATAFADPRHGGSGRHEPMIMTIDYGQGRVFHTPMGHADYSFECVGFITVFLRGTEWAATGNVSQHDLPADFPAPDRPRQRTFAP